MADFWGWGLSAWPQRLNNNSNNNNSDNSNNDDNNNNNYYHHTEISTVLNDAYSTINITVPSSPEIENIIIMKLSIIVIIMIITIILIILIIITIITIIIISSSHD